MKNALTGQKVSVLEQDKLHRFLIKTLNSIISFKITSENFVKYGFTTECNKLTNHWIVAVVAMQYNYTNDLILKHLE